MAQNFFNKLLGYLKDQYSDFTIMDISSLLSLENYKTFLNEHEDKIIYLSKRNEQTEGIFLKEGSFVGNVIILYKKNILCLESFDFERTKNIVRGMLENNRTSENCKYCNEAFKTILLCSCDLCESYCCNFCLNILAYSKSAILADDIMGITCPFCQKENGFRLDVGLELV